MKPDAPLVSVGVPVFNGDRHLTETLESLLRQDLGDFELIISDNASTDTTPAICQDYAKRDRRVRYDRNPTNLGAAANYNRLVELARGTYFKWAPHDDVYAPSFLRECVEELRAADDAVLCYPQTSLIDEDGNPLGQHQEWHDARSASPVERLRQLLQDSDSWCNSILGVIRLDTLRQTRLIGSFGGSDHVLLAELVLRGAFHEIPRPLLFRRVYGGQSPSLQNNSTPEEVAAWFDPARGRRAVMPRTTLLWEHVRAIKRAPLTRRERWACYGLLRTTPFEENWGPALLLGEARRVIRRTVWETHLLGALRRARRQYLPHRLWAMLSGLKRREWRRVLLALAPPTPATHAALLQFVASCLSQRTDRESREVLGEWLSSEREAQRAAAAWALGQDYTAAHAGM